MQHDNNLTPYWTAMVRELIFQKKISIEKIAAVILEPEETIKRVESELHFAPPHKTFLKIFCLYQKVFYLNAKNIHAKRWDSLRLLVKSTDLPEDWLDQKI